MVLRTRYITVTGMLKLIGIPAAAKIAVIRASNIPIPPGNTDTKPAKLATA
jgi:hypothetical protein